LIIDLLLFNFCDKLSFSPGSENNSEGEHRGGNGRRKKEKKDQVLWKPCADYRVHRLINHARVLQKRRKKNENSKKDNNEKLFEFNGDLLRDWSFFYCECGRETSREWCKTGWL
jgi:hypothetical protein